jgi:hypothetical protein
MSNRILEGTPAHISACLSALQTLQTSVPGASTQAAMNALFVTYYRAIIASCKANNNNAGIGPPLDALRSLGVNV